MFRRLLHRNIALMVGVVLAGQLIAGFLVMGLVVRPQVTRVANVTADMIGALSDAMERLTPTERSLVIMSVNAGDSMAVRPVADVPPDGPRFPTFVERQFIRVLAQRLSAQEVLIWRTDHDGRLWFRLHIGGGAYWVSVMPPRQGGALAALTLAFVVAFLVSVACGLALQRRIDKPLRRLAGSLQDFRTDGTQPPIDEGGPEEVAALASALNRMSERIAGQEADRALMLAGVSHDLRTPLTKLRLMLELMQGYDPELESGAVRQVERIETMLAQFLDFARGFESEALRRVDVGALLHDVVVRAELSDDVEVAVPVSLQEVLRPQAVARAVENLLVNAMRHGAAPVILSAAAQDGALAIRISDGGGGFDPAMAEAIVRPFARGDSARGGQGTGLGLAIARRVATAHGGQLRFARHAGRFDATLELPTGDVDVDKPGM